MVIGTMSDTHPDRSKVFISYSHEDKKWLERLQKHLKPMERQGIVDRWDDTRIDAGQEWKEEIKKAIDEAKVAVLLISADFLASDFIAENELPPLLSAAKKDGLVVLPVILSPSRFTRTPSLYKFHAVNDPAKPLVDLTEGDRARVWVKVTEDIEKALPGFTRQQEPETPEIPSEEINQESLQPLPVSEDRHKGWKYVVGVVFLLLALTISFLWFNNYFDNPVLTVLNPILNPNSGITVIAGNETANQETPIIVEFDGLRFENAGIIIPDTNPQQWHLDLISQLNLPDELLQDGFHTLRVGMSAQALSDSIAIYFSSQAPIVDVGVISEEGQATILGQAASRTQLLADTISVELVFRYQGAWLPVSIPVERKINDDGLIYFGFETTVHDMPSYAPEDSLYSAPFFAMRVTDTAGNEYYQVESYAQFISPGDKYFGIGNIADFEMQRHSGDRAGGITLDLTLYTRQNVHDLADNEELLILDATKYVQNINHLIWTDPPESPRLANTVTTILRDNEPLAISFRNQYTDFDAPDDRDVTYQVEQQVPDGTYRRSNIAVVSVQDEVKETLSPVTAQIDMVIQEAEFYLGTPFRWGGSSKQGIDNAALMQNSFRAVGIQLPRTTQSQATYNGLDSLTISDLKRGDLVFFRTSRLTRHNGLVADVTNGQVRFIHASTSQGVTYSHLSGSWSKIFIKGKRIIVPSLSNDSEEPPAIENTPEPVPYLPGKYPEASQRRLTRSDIQGMSEREIQIMKDEIYARYGYEFHTNPEMVEYFNSQAWYREIPNKTRDSGSILHSSMSHVEKSNIIFLRQRLQEMM